MSELKKGQIVACWIDDGFVKVIRIFDHKRCNKFMCRLPDNTLDEEDEFGYCMPLEEVEPSAFLGREKPPVEEDHE